MTEYLPAKTEKTLEYSPIFKLRKDNKHNTLHLARKFARICCPWTLFVPRSSHAVLLKLRSRKPVRFSDPIMCASFSLVADKLSSIFSSQMEAIVFYCFTIIPTARVGYAIVESQRGAYHGRVGYNHLVSNERG